MQRRAKTIFRLIALYVVLLAALYIAAYLLIVRRKVAPSGPENTLGGGTRQYYAVYARIGRGVWRAVFTPALKIDRGFLRKRYWEGWYVFEDGNGTNVVYERDLVIQNGQ